VLGAMVGVYLLRPRGVASAPVSTPAPRETLAREIVAETAQHPAAIRPATELPEAYRGVVIDGATGEPVEDAQVRLCRGIKAGHPACADSVASTDTDASGRFLLERPEEPVGALVVDIDGFGTAVVNSPGAVSRVELWPPSVVKVRVVDKQGKPLEGVRVGW